MTKLFRHIIRNMAWLPVLFVALALAACDRESESVDPTIDSSSEPGYSVSIRIYADSPTRSRSELPEEPGVGLENSIDLLNLKIVVFDENGLLKDIWFRDGNAIGNAKLLELEKHGEYLLSSRLESDKYSTSSKFSVVALANWNSLEENGPVELLIGVTKFEDLAEYAFRLNADTAAEAWIPTNDSLIPMFGVLYADISAYSKSIYSEGNPMNLGVINLLRSVVKIEVIDNVSQQNINENRVEITSILLTQRNCRGLLTPDIFDHKNTHQVTSANLPAEPDYVTTPLLFHKNEDSNTYVAYVPEMALGETIESRTSIDVNIKYQGYNEYEETRKISFAPYVDGYPVLPEGELPAEWKALLRNHIYRFTINSIPVNTELDLTVDVQPYSCETLLPDFGLERTEDGYIVVRNSKGDIIKYIRPNGEVLTFKTDNRWPYLGTFMGVFDSSKRVLVGYFPDGRSIIFNYTSDEIDENDVLKNLESWEIYSKPSLTDSNGKKIPEHMEETFCFINYYYDEDYNVDDDNASTEDMIILKHKYTHTIFDNKGRVIEEYRYPTLIDFQHHKETSVETYSRTKLADYTGQRYGNKVITYYKDNGNGTSTEICKLTIVNDKETYDYETSD